MCTTVPPAKSSTPSLKRNPSGCQVQWASGAYTNRLNRIMNSTYDRKLIRSAIDPVTRAGVMTANLSWKKAKTTSGMVAANDHGLPSSTPLNMKNVPGLPTNPPIVSPNARLKPTTTQSMLITPMAMKLCSMVEITFLLFTIPP